MRPKTILILIIGILAVMYFQDNLSTFVIPEGTTCFYISNSGSGALRQTCDLDNVVKSSTGEKVWHRVTPEEYFMTFHEHNYKSMMEEYNNLQSKEKDAEYPENEIILVWEDQQDTENLGLTNEVKINPIDKFILWFKDLLGGLF